MANITGDGNFTSKLNQAQSSSPAGIIEFFSALNIFLAITASLGNALILIALHKVSFIYPPTKLFFRCLAVTDLFIGLFIQPIYTTEIMSHIIKIDMDSVFTESLRSASAWILCGVSALTSTGISVDRLLAMLLGLRYKHVVTLRRVRVVIICFWLIGALAGSIRMLRIELAIKGASVILTFSLVTTVFCYIKIHLKLRHRQAQLHNNFFPGPIAIGGGIPLNIARYKKSVSSIFWVQLALVTCYVPFSIAVTLSAKEVSCVVWRSTETLVFLNSSLNPILYCWKIREVKQAVRDMIRQFYCF